MTLSEGHPTRLWPRRQSASRSSLRPLRPGALAALAIVALSACISSEVTLPEPRRLVIHSGARLAPTRDRMEEVDGWVREQYDSIQMDPSFWIISEPEEGPVYPWERLRVTAGADTAFVSFQPTSGGGNLHLGAYQIYAHLHIMAAQGRLDRWLPEAVGLDDFELERAILARVADAWLYQRSIFDARPYGVLDEITYAHENGFLDAFILTARPDAFVEARRTWMAANPDAGTAYVEWFRRTFERDPPGRVSGDR